MDATGPAQDRHPTQDAGAAVRAGAQALGRKRPAFGFGHADLPRNPAPRLLGRSLR